jgi:tRNA pseudouridine13 synthase
MHFHLQKTNRETHDALGAIASVLHVTTRDLGVTGTKDKRSVSVQRVSLRRGDRPIEDVWRAINYGAPGVQRGGRGRGRGGGRFVDMRSQMRGITVGNFSYEPAGLELGQLGGNRFGIVLRCARISSCSITTTEAAFRDVKTTTDDAIDRAVATLRDRGFINYFGWSAVHNRRDLCSPRSTGMQRFGASSIGTNIVGLAILQGNFALAADLVLRPRPMDSPEIVEARAHWRDHRDAKAALRLMPRNCIGERCRAYRRVAHSIGLTPSFQSSSSTPRIPTSATRLPLARHVRPEWLDCRF